ncbi:MAG: hydrogenase expression/formation protein HypE [Kosmotogaceae bacterium]
MNEIITVHHNSGRKQYELIELINKELGDRLVSTENDGGILTDAVDTFTADSFTIKPLFFPGGDIGNLSISGSVNDTIMLGARPLYLSLSLVIEEGLKITTLKNILNSIRKELETTDTYVLCGDTKVVDKGEVDGLIINTTCLGKAVKEALTVDRIKNNDSIIVTGPLGLHGAAVMAYRNGFEIDFESDCSSIMPLLDAVKKYDIHVMRDLTRGGFVQILNELAISSRKEITIDENLLRIPAGVESVSEILGINPLYLACEGTAAVFCNRRVENELLTFLKNRGLSPFKAGNVGKDAERPLVSLRSNSGAERVLPMLIEELTPRIC